MEYMAWNDLISARFFNPERAGLLRPEHLPTGTAAVGGLEYGVSGAQPTSR